jgi:hypothetical protein
VDTERRRKRLDSAGTVLIKTAGIVSVYRNTAKGIIVNVFIE